jgi:hypothetical protein
MKTLTLTDEQARALKGILVREFDRIIDAMDIAYDHGSKEEYDAARTRMINIQGILTAEAAA